MIIYRKANASDIRPALDLALRVFIKFHTPDCEQKAISSYFTARFKDECYLNDFESEQNLMFVALDGERIVGMINEHGNDHHIAEMAVDGAYHRRGIATELMNRMVCELKLRGIDKITLKALPHGLPFYLKYGFVPTDIKQRSKSGFDFTPMAYEPNEIWDVLDKDGNKTGRYHERGRKMATGDYHLCVHVWKHNGRGEWLIDKRTKKSPDDTCGGKWETTGGAAIAGDDSLTAALRETNEELGLDLDPTKGVLFRRFAREGFYGHTYLMDVWVFKHDCAIEDVRFQERETCEAMWANAEQIRELIKSNEFFSDVDLYFDEMANKFTPYYLAYERRYQAVYASGATLWGHTTDDEVLINTLTDWVEKNNLRGKKIVEFACGEGSIGQILSELGCIYHGVDIVPSAVERSKQALVKYPNATVSVLDMVNERVEGLYDAAVDSMGLHMAVMGISEIEPLFKAVYEMLRHGGVFVFSATHPCFQTPDKSFTPDGNGVIISDYINPKRYSYQILADNPKCAYHWHRPLQKLLRICFETGFILDGLEEPVFDEGKCTHAVWARVPLPIVMRVRKERI